MVAGGRGGSGRAWDGETKRNLPLQSGFLKGIAQPMLQGEAFAAAAAAAVAFAVVRIPKPSLCILYSSNCTYHHTEPCSRGPGVRGGSHIFRSI